MRVLELVVEVVEEEVILQGREILLELSLVLLL
jgi:hypothetical protein